MFLKPALALRNNGVVCFVGAGGKTSLMFRLAKELAASDETVLTTTTTKIRIPTRQQAPRVILGTTAREIETEAHKHFGQLSHLCAASKQIPEQRGKLRGFTPATIDTLHRHGLAQWILVEADGAAGRPLKAPADHEPVIPNSTSHTVVVIGLDSIGRALDETTVFRPERFSLISGLPPDKAITERSVVNAIQKENGLLKGCPKTATTLIFLNKADTPERLRAARSIVQLLKEASIPDVMRVLIGSAKSDAPVMESHNLR